VANIVEIVSIVIAVLIAIGTALVITDIQNNTPSAIPTIHNQDPHLNTMGFQQHMVSFRVEPPALNTLVTICDNVTFDVKLKYTDETSEVTFPMVSSYKYSVNVQSHNISVNLYPIESEYVLVGRIA